MTTTSRTEAAAVRSWVRDFVEANSTTEPIALVESVVAAIAKAIEGDPTIEPDAATTEPPPGGWANVWLPGLVHEQAVSVESRNARGAWYTPESVVRGLVKLATFDEVVPGLAADPTCGGGAFLLAALERMVELGLAPSEALARVAGLDIDPGAVQVSRWSIRLWAAARGVDLAESDIDVSVGDALAGYPQHWSAALSNCGLLIGNPPFATPLRTGAIPPEVAAFRLGREQFLGPYTDLAAMHLLGAIERSSTGSVVALVQPQSVLAGRDSKALRDHCDSEAPVYSLWAAREPLFDAGVRACAAVLHPGAPPPDQVRLACGPDVVVEDVEPYRARAWAGYAARALGAPGLPPQLANSAAASEMAPRARLGSLVTATAGFRDEYYGLVAACGEWHGEIGAEPNRLLTVGSVEPLATKWVTDPCRFGRRPWLRPWVDCDQLEPKVKAWADRQLRPKVVLATQSRILEPVVDWTGTVVPATPLIAVHADLEDLALVAAVFLAPPVVAWAWQQWFGAALAVDALKLAARQVLELPLPPDREAWVEASALITSFDSDVSVADGWAVSREVAAIMNRAYRADGAVLRWWEHRAGNARSGHAV